MLVSLRNFLDFRRLSFLPALVLVIACLCVNVLALKGHFHIMREMSDGGTFYVGAKLLGTPQLYDVGANLAAQEEYTRHENQGLIYCRLPYVVWLWKPLAALPYWRSEALWRALCVLALVATVFVFPGPRKVTWIAVAISVAAMHAVIFGQDLPILLLAMAVSLALLRQGRDVWAGIALSLLASKFHFLVLTPIAILIFRRFRFLAGAAIGGAAEIAVSYAVQGRNWPIEFWRVLTMPTMNVYPRVMPNFFGVFATLPHPMAWTVTADLLAIIVLALICVRIRDFALCLMLCIAGAVLTSPHAYAHDCVLLLPALLLLAQEERYRPWATLLMLPIIYLAVGHWIPTVGPILFVLPVSALLVALAVRPSGFIRTSTSRPV